MSLEPITDETTRLMRLAWFRFLDTVEPFRQDLHRYCLRLTRNLWSAEDLVQDTLLRGYAAIARGDLHGETSKMCNRRAYLFRTASNLWIDQVRHARLEAGAEDEPTPAQSNAEMSVSVRDAGARLFEAAAPEWAEVVVGRASGSRARCGTRAGGSRCVSCRASSWSRTSTSRSRVPFSTVSRASRKSMARSRASRATATHPRRSQRRRNSSALRLGTQRTISNPRSWSR